jgi:hypothetical protein
MKSSEFYRHRTWRMCTKYILLYYSNNGVVFCITCGKPMFIDDKDCCTGHLIKVYDGNRTNFSTAFEFTNLAPQCNAICNRRGNGKPDIMYRKLVELHGQDAIDKLYIKKNNPLKLDAYYLDILYKEFKQKFDELVKVKGNPWLK